MPLLDTLLIELDRGLKAVTCQARAERPCPGGQDGPLSEPERRLSEGLIRIDHVGEICAQGLYNGQAAVARKDATEAMLRQAASEEEDHLAWCEQRLDELKGRTSYLNPLWYAGSWLIGAVAGCLGDHLSLGFVIETERQVEAHLEDHLRRLPKNDQRSRAMLAQMAEDEVQHAEHAAKRGGQPLPQPMRWLMKGIASVMTTSAYWI